jgi:hypothetical protein
MNGKLNFTDVAVCRTPLGRSSNTNWPSVIWMLFSEKRGRGPESVGAPLTQRSSQSEMS